MEVHYSIKKIAMFFTKNEIQSNAVAVNKKLSCYSCGLYKGDISSPKMAPFGNFKKKILNIGDFTTGVDDAAGKPFQGKNKKIYAMYAKLGIDIEEDCLNVNSVMCFPYDKKTLKDREPSAHEINCCTINIQKVIQQYKPQLIVLFGRVALQSVIGPRWNKSLDKLEKWRGFVIPEQTYKCWVAPVFSPSYVNVVDRPEVTLVWEQDLKNALRHLEIRFPVTKEPKINVITDLSILNEITYNSIVSFDYETTGLKPHAEGHKIVCASVAVSEDEVYVFEMPNKPEKRKPFIDLLKNKFIKKMAHNMKYEETWSHVILQTRVKAWFWDTMIMAHILDNRQGVTGLKFQTYVNFGVGDYSSHIEKYLEAKDPKNANSKNDIEKSIKIHKRDILTYCALDSIYQYRLAMKQMEVIDNILPF